VLDCPGQPQVSSAPASVLVPYCFLCHPGALSTSGLLLRHCAVLHAQCSVPLMCWCRTAVPSVAQPQCPVSCACFLLQLYCCAICCTAAGVDDALFSAPAAVSIVPYCFCSTCCTAAAVEHAQRQAMNSGQACACLACSDGVMCVFEYVHMVCCAECMVC
jgi:hypothetical protein